MPSPSATTLAAALALALAACGHARPATGPPTFDPGDAGPPPSASWGEATRAGERPWVEPPTAPDAARAVGAPGTPPDAAAPPPSAVDPAQAAEIDGDRPADASAATGPPADAACAPGGDGPGSGGAYPAEARCGAAGDGDAATAPVAAPAPRWDASCEPGGGAPGSGGAYPAAGAACDDPATDAAALEASSASPGDGPRRSGAARGALTAVGILWVVIGHALAATGPFAPFAVAALVYFWPYTLGVTAGVAALGALVGAAADAGGAEGPTPPQGAPAAGAAY